MEADKFHWPDDDVAWQQVFEADPSWGIDHGVHVFVMKDVEALRRACEDPEAGAWSLSYRKPDSGNNRALIMLAPPATLSAVVHEVTHVALYWARDTARRKQRAFGWLGKHPESVPILTGNLASVIWYNLPLEFIDQGA